MANKIKCTCGHSWNKSDSSKKDVNVCHVCGKDNTMKNGGWLDNYGKADNANDSDVSLPEGFVGMGNDTTGRNYSPAWGGQFQTGGSIPGSVGFTYARTGNIPSEGKYAKKTLPSAQNGQEMKFYQEGLDWKPKSMQNGGIIEDDNGYLNPNNQGKMVRINSNLITMNGVDQPLIGISDTGDVQYMTPGNDYKFKGSKVTEIPVAQNGEKLQSSMSNPITYGSRKIMQLTNVPLPARTLISDVMGGTDTIDESDLSNEDLTALRDVVRKNLAKGKNTIEYNDYGTSDDPYSDVSSLGLSSMMNKLKDPYYRLKTTLGQSAINISDGDTTVIDKYDFNDKGKRSLKTLMNNIQSGDMYQSARTFASLMASGPEDNSSKVKINISEKPSKLSEFFNSGPQYGRYAGMPVFDKKKKNGGSVGINQLDSQPKKKLNQLLNFTNNPDKTNWLDKYQ